MASPLQMFLEARGAQQQFQGQQDLQRQRAEMAGLQSQQQRQALGQQQKQFDQAQVLQGAQIMQQFVNRVKEIPESDIQGRLSLFQAARPELEVFGITLPQEITPESVTNQGLVPLETGLGRSVQQLTGQERFRQGLMSDLEGAIDPNTGRLKPLDELTAVQRAAAVQLRLAPGAQGSAAQTISELGTASQIAETERTIETGKVRGKQQAEIEGVSIAEGRDAAKGVPVLRRSLELLDSVKTGGFNQASNAIKRAFGVEGGDEGELSANLGQAILGDLRATFGAAFTEKEGARLERIRANFGRSAAVNRRLIQQALDIATSAANRAIDDAIDAGDTRTAEEIQDLLDFSFSSEEAQTEAPKRSGGQIMIDANGNRAMVYPDGTFEEL